MLLTYFFKLMILIINDLSLNTSSSKSDRTDKQESFNTAKIYNFNQETHIYFLKIMGPGRLYHISCL